MATDLPQETASETPVRARPADDDRLGARLREARLAAGLSQSRLAGGRVSKEYISQIERGKTRPTGETLAWLAGQLGIDASYLASGVSGAERARVEATLARGEALAESHRYAEAVHEYERVGPEAAGSADLDLRRLTGEAWALIHVGDLKRAIAVLQQARVLSERPEFSDVERAGVLFHLGVARYKLSSISTALALFGEALALAERSGLPCDLLRARILEWRSRGYRRLRDWEAAREDVERAVELAQGVSDLRVVANAYFQASLVAEREGHWVLARSYAERARAAYEQLSDRANVGRLLNNLGGLTYSLGRPEEAIGYLKDSFRVALETGSDPDAGHVMLSLAEVHLGTGEPETAESEARKALELFAGRVDYLHGIGTAQLTLGRALLEQDRLNEAEEMFRAADSSFEQLSSISHRAAAWVALGDLATKRGIDAEAARLYRRAAESLQDFRF